MVFLDLFSFYFTIFHITGGLLVIRFDCVEVKKIFITIYSALEKSSFYGVVCQCSLYITHHTFSLSHAHLHTWYFLHFIRRRQQFFFYSLFCLFLLSTFPQLFTAFAMRMRHTQITKNIHFTFLFSRRGCSKS